MKLGYLHIGPPEHGVSRYGRLIAAEGRRRSDIDLIDADVVLGDDVGRNRELLVEAAQRLSRADVVHFQFAKANEPLWGARWSQVRNLDIFMRHCSRPLVVTLHDVYYSPYSLKEVLARRYQKLRGTRTTSHATAVGSLAPSTKTPSPGEESRFTVIRNLVRDVVRNTWSAEAIALGKVVRRADAVLVCTEEEARRLESRIGRRKLHVIPHFVEERGRRPDRVAARKMLGLDSCRVVTLLGFIFPSKGHKILVEALPHLPDDVCVVFAGTAARRDFEELVRQLLDSARANGVGDRLRLTGYLPESDLDDYLIATDLAVCPFSRMSASSSMASWIAVGCPILASDIPQVREFNSWEPDAIRVFRPYTPMALAGAIRRILDAEQETQRQALARLAGKLATSLIFDEHLKCYTRIVENRR
jgi:glycosyltransferase involved in cell wall biosynthesis